jgi:predicted lipoprotein with Yx(FWY)xxD motif
MESDDMEQTDQRGESAWHVSVRRAMAVVVAVGGLAASAVATSTAEAATNPLISTAKNAQLGTILVSGNTLYTLKSSRTACGARCISTWPEVLLPKGVRKATAGPGVNAAKLGTIARSGGVLQVTYSGKPIYWFAQDTAPGQVNGITTDTWGKWSVVVTKKPAGSSSGSGNSSAGTGGASF